jgi:hypothetical protein
VQALGWLPANPANNTTTLALNAANTWLGYSFIADHATSLSKVRAFLSAKAGTLTSTDITCDLYSDSAGKPGSSLESRNTITSGLTAGAWGEWTGFTTSLTAGTQYWLVWKNVNGTPGTNFPTFRWAASGTGPAYTLSTSGTWGWIKSHTTTGGGGFGTVVTPGGGWRVQYADGSYDGCPIQNIAASSDLVYSARESGVKFTTPGGAILQACGIAAFLATSIGTPTGNPRLRLYTGGTPSLIATTNTIANALALVNGWYYGYFTDGTHGITPGSTVRLTLGEDSNSDASSNAFKLHEYTWDSDANSLALTPLEGTWGKTYFDGSAWTDTASGLFAIGLLLESGGEFASAGGGSIIGSSIIQSARAR